MLFGVVLVVGLTFFCIYCIKHDQDVQRNHNKMLHNNSGGGSVDDESEI